MKIRLESEKIIQAVKKQTGIELVLQDEADGKEAIELVLGKSELRNHPSFPKLREVRVMLTREYKTSAVDYRTLFLLEFLFDESLSLEEKASLSRRFKATSAAFRRTDLHDRRSGFFTGSPDRQEF